MECGSCGVECGVWSELVLYVVWSGVGGVWGGCRCGVV